MIKLKMSNPSARGLRYELLELLGLETPPQQPILVCQTENTDWVNPGYDAPEVVAKDSAEPEVAVVGDDKKSRKRRTKAQIEADALAAEAAGVDTGLGTTCTPVVAAEVEEVVPPVEVVEVAAPEVADNPNKITPHILRAACIKASDRVGGDPVFAVLAEYGAKSAAEVKDADMLVVFDTISKMGL